MVGKPHKILEISTALNGKRYPWSFGPKGIPINAYLDTVSHISQQDQMRGHFSTCGCLACFS